jgi:hypothetical protein
LITNDGKEILSKYLIGQAPTYASHIAIGCGTEPLEFSEDLEDYSNKKSLDFEMFRVPIVSRGYVEEDGVSRIVFTGELPSEERYEITEMGVFSSGSNVNAGASDSKILFTFSSSENWEFHETSSSGIAQSLTQEFNPLYDEAQTDKIKSDFDSTAFLANSTNGVFDNEQRLVRHERPRLLDSSVFISGNTCQLKTKNSNDLEVEPDSLSNHIHYTNINISEVAQNSSNDILKTAFSVISKDAADDVGPDEVKIIVEFLSSETEGATLARMPITYTSYAPAPGSPNPNYVNFFNNRYLVKEKTIGELFGKENGFTWQSVNVLRIYSSVEKIYSISGVALASGKLEFTTTSDHGFAVGTKVFLTGVSDSITSGVITDIDALNKFKIVGTTLPTLTSAKAKAPTSNYLVSLDGIRLENVSTPNALYALTAYSPIVNLKRPIVKNANTSNVVEFRFAMSVGAEENVQS